jgi:DNA-binding response OmpR family regulator
MAIELTALVIEDECTIGLLLKHVLKERGINTFQVISLKEARNIMKELNPDFIFVDNDLPDGSGFSTIPSMHQKCPDAQIIAMTANNSFQGHQTAFTMGADFFLEKPFTINQVYKTLKKEYQRLEYR